MDVMIISPDDRNWTYCANFVSLRRNQAK